MRIAASCALIAAAVAANAGPALATANWDYVCSADDNRVHIDVALVFNQGTAGRISVTEVNAAAHNAAKDASKDDVVSFAADDIEQYWLADDAFRISFSRYQGGDPEPARLVIDTTCNKLDCKGTYSYSRNATNSTGSISCKAGEKG